jgi:A/G-specific adenine glycosylase
MSPYKSLIFQQNLLAWFATNHRPLPWKGERDPYLIWLSEIILQQTTVAQGMPYFEKFRTTYPSVTDLANAPDDNVMKLWEGLGYYSRARNLLATARHIAFERNGSFPTTYTSILGLKGVGTYTAAAIASFAYDLPHAVVDGNVYRVLSRVFGIETPIDSTEGKKIFAQLADAVLDKTRPADFNQAIMDFGATHCTPQKPNCKNCPMATICVALKDKKVETLPIKSKKLTKRERYFNYLVINQGESVFIRKRTAKDIWQDLYEFYLVETNGVAVDFSGLDAENHPLSNLPLKLLFASKPYCQQLTHQRVNGIFWEIDANDNAEIEKILRGANFEKIKRSDLPTFAFPKIVDNYLKEKVLTLF